MSRLSPLFRGRPRIIVGLGAVLGLYLVLLLASFVDPSFAGDVVGRNTSFFSHPVGGMSEVDLEAWLASTADGYGPTPVDIDAGFGPVRSDAAALGLTLDVAASSQALRHAGRTSFLTRPFAWLGSFVRDRDVEPRFMVDEAALHSALEVLDIPGITEARLPSLEGDGEGVRVVPGTSGSGIEAASFQRRLVEAAEATPNDGTPLHVVPELVDVVPEVSDEAAAAAAAEAEAATARSISVTVGEVSRPLGVGTLRSWLVLEVAGEGAGWTFDPTLVDADLAQIFSDAAEPGTDVHFTVEDGEVALIEGTGVATCCAPDSAQRLLEALRAGDAEVQLELEVTETEHGLAWAQELGIIEQVATFTTNHPCCQNRVTNIQLMADAVRGAIIEPGEVFSLNEYVGERTAEKGYLYAGGITNGVLVDQLGGGVSQFTTTLFNAAFFAGLDFTEYQAHTIYFSRYPYGREATLSWPDPDLAFRNTTPYGILIWPTYTSTSITVTLYSTKYVEVEQTGQTTSMLGSCTRVQTERTRTYLDGRVEIDHVNAQYRPSEGLNCAGQPTVSTTTTTTTLPEGGSTTLPDATSSTVPPEPTSTSSPPSTEATLPTTSSVPE